MKTFATAVSIFALLTCAASATPCSDICTADCALHKQACDVTGVMGSLCGTVNGVCTKACAAACGCADSCATQCGGDFANCKGATGVFDLNILSCGLNLSVCASTCQLKCRFNMFAGIVNAIKGTVTGGGQVAF